MTPVEKTKGIAICSLILGVIDDASPCKMFPDHEDCELYFKFDKVVKI